jgi:hypothetical protein
MFANFPGQNGSAILVGGTPPCMECSVDRRCRMRWADEVAGDHLQRRSQVHAFVFHAIHAAPSGSRLCMDDTVGQGQVPLGYRMARAGRSVAFVVFVQRRPRSADAEPCWSRCSEPREILYGNWSRVMTTTSFGRVIIAAIAVDSILAARTRSATP